MKAFAMRATGDFDQLGLVDLPDPSLRSDDHVVVLLEAAALNHLDLWTLRGLPGLNFEFPHILGADGAGVVGAVGSAVTQVQTGDSVMLNPGVSCHRCRYCLEGRHSLCLSYGLLGEHRHGTLTEAIVVPEPNVVPVPRLPGGHEQLSWAEAAAFPLVSLTAWHMLVERARVRAGETVLIWGIGGGVAGTALKIAKLHGAVVIATSSSEEKLAWAREQGADLVLNHDEVDVAKEVRAATKKAGVDIVVETVGEATWERSLRVLGRGGRLVTCGATTGAHVSIDVRRLFWHQWDILGSTMGGDGDLRAVTRVLANGHLRPTIDSVHAFDHALGAFERLTAGSHLGKVVVDVRGRANEMVLDGA